MSVTLVLTERQAEYLSDIIDMWAEGHKDAARDVLSEDMAHTYDTPEELLRAVDQINWQYADAIDLKMKLTEARRQ